MDEPEAGVKLDVCPITVMGCAVIYPAEIKKMLVNKSVEIVFMFLIYCDKNMNKKKTDEEINVIQKTTICKSFSD